MSASEPTATSPLALTTTSSADCELHVKEIAGPRAVLATNSNCVAPVATAPARLRRGYWVPAKLAFLMTLAQRTVSDFT